MADRGNVKSADAFRTISEVSKELDVPQHVLRFWESKFTQIKPMKRAGGRRYYRPDDVALISVIRGLLYDDGYTIKGVQKVLKEKGVKAVIEVEAGDLADTDAGAPMTEDDQTLPLPFDMADEEKPTSTPSASQVTGISGAANDPVANTTQDLNDGPIQPAPHAVTETVIVQVPGLSDEDKAALDAQMERLGVIRDRLKNLGSGQEGETV